MTPREALLGPSYRHHVHLIERSRTWTTSEIEAYQQARLKKLIRRYGEKITYKEDYWADLDRYTRWNVPLLMQTIRTGGTSGEPLRFRMDTLARRQKELAYMFNIWSTIGYSPFDLRVVYRGKVDDRLYRFEQLQNRWVVSASSSTADRPDLRQWARKLRPFFLHVYPSSLFTFIDLLGESLFRTLPVMGILAGSESFPAGEADRFERDFGIPVVHWYGHSEFAVLAYRCKICKGFHFFPTYGNVELLTSNDDGLWRIVASSFNRTGTQFVRYDTGDLAESPVRVCADKFPLVGNIVGRSQETFVDDTGFRRALGPYIFGIHGSFWDRIRDLQFIQESAGKMRVCLVAEENADRSQIQKVLEQRLPMVRLDFDYVSRIERLSNGKRGYFINKSECTKPELALLWNSHHAYPAERLNIVVDAIFPHVDIAAKAWSGVGETSLLDTNPRGPVQTWLQHLLSRAVRCDQRVLDITSAWCGLGCLTTSAIVQQLPSSDSSSPLII